MELASTARCLVSLADDTNGLTARQHEDMLFARELLSSSIRLPLILIYLKSGICFGFRDDVENRSDAPRTLRMV